MKCFGHNVVPCKAVGQSKYCTNHKSGCFIPCHRLSACSFEFRGFSTSFLCDHTMLRTAEHSHDAVFCSSSGRYPSVLLSVEASGEHGRCSCPGIVHMFKILSPEIPAFIPRPRVLRRLGLVALRATKS